MTLKLQPGVSAIQTFCAGGSRDELSEFAQRKSATPAQIARVLEFD